MAVSVFQVPERKVREIMNLTQDEADTLLEQLAEHFLPLRQEGDIDRMQVAEMYDRSITSAGDKLQQLVKEGVLIDGKLAWDPAKRTTVHVYRKA